MSGHVPMDRAVFDRLVLLADAGGERFDSDAVADPVAVLARWAAEMPDRTAVVTPSGAMSFAELDLLSRRLAGRLEALLRQRGAPIVACGEIGPLHFAALAAALRLGVPLVPLDPQRSPLRNRQAVLLARAGAAVCAGPAEAIVRHIGPGVPIVSLDDLAGEAAADFDRGGASDPAMVVFTSGSTGLPKGVVKSRRSLAEAFRIRRHVLGLGPDDTSGIAGSSAVTGVQLNCWNALVGGATLALISPGESVGTIVDFFAAQGVTVTQFYVGFGRIVAQHPSAGEKLAGLRIVTLFGDVVLWSDIARLRSVLPDTVRIYCSFGATEASWTVGWEAPAGAVTREGRVPIGACLPGATLWLNPGEVPNGSGAGELVVTSPRVAAGYWDDAELTASRFSAHPDAPDRTIFRTGDMVRVGDDGAIEFLGREDNQIKLHGWRIELEEIESVARTAPQVGAACVVVRRDAQGLPQSLALYVAPAGEAAVHGRVVAEALRAELPIQMRPAEIVTARHLPMNQSAKVDRARVVEIDRQRLERASAAPEAAGPEALWRDPVARRIAGAIAGELARGGVAPDARFIEIGGDSLQALACALAVERLFGVTIDPEDFLDDVPLSELVGRIAEQTRLVSREVIGGR